MANLSEDIQCAGLDTRPPMLDRTDFASWQQRIRLYYRGKDNGVNILKSIDEGTYKLVTFRETLAESTEGTPQLGPERPRVYSDLKYEEKDRGLRDSNYDQLFAYLKQHEAHAKENKMILERLSQPTADPLALLSNVSNTQHGSPSSSTSSITPLPLPRANSRPPANNLIENLTSTLALLTQSYRTFLPQTNNQLRTSSNARNQAIVQDGRVVVQNVQGRPNRGQEMNPQGGSDAGYEEAQNRVGNAQENGVALDAEHLLFIADIDEAPTTQTMFMANLSSADPITDEAGPSYDSNILSEAQNDLLRAENDKIKQHYKELYDSIKITRAMHIEQVTKLTTENVNLKTYVSKATIKPQVSARDKHAIDVEPIISRLRNNRDAHLDYLRHLTESVKTIYDIVEEAKVVRPLDRSIVSACRYTKHSQELLEYAIGTCPQGSQQRAKQLASTPLIRKKQITISKPSYRQDSNKQVHVVVVKPQKTNVPVPPSTGVISYPKSSGSQPKSNPKTNRISPAKGANKLVSIEKSNKNIIGLRISRSY
nr:hypothetical protein [Tanacetum cinerariifolium]